MKLFSWEDIQGVSSMPEQELRSFFASGSAVTIGGFDGPHRGHHILFEKVLARKDFIPGVVTFRRSPRASGKTAENGKYAGDVSTLPLKISVFGKKGFVFVIVIDFSSDFGKLSGRKFLEILKSSCNMRFLAVGPDFRCGYRLDTGVAEIKDFAGKNGIAVEVAEPYLLDEKRVSSSSIRDAVEQGNFLLAENLLGAPFLLDFSKVRWHRTPGGLSAGRDALTQIMPPVGEYPVFILSENTPEVCGMLKVTDRLVSVSITGKSAEAGIKTVRFRLS